VRASPAEAQEWNVWEHSGGQGGGLLRRAGG